MSEIRIDLYSDTATRPTPQMRAFMCEAPVGDEQKGEDPTVNRLQEMVAELLGMEAAVLLPSGTMCNQIALAAQCLPGDLVLLDRTAHPLTSEAGGVSSERPPTPPQSVTRHERGFGSLRPRSSML